MGSLKAGRCRRNINIPYQYSEAFIIFMAYILIYSICSPIRDTVTYISVVYEVVIALKLSVLLIKAIQRGR